MATYTVEICMQTYTWPQPLQRTICVSTPYGTDAALAIAVDRAHNLCAAYGGVLSVVTGNMEQETEVE